MINSIKLKNWQKHKSLELEFSKGINVISGESNAGKSCIRRALGWILFADNISEKDYRREGSKNTVVTVILDSGVEIERERSNSTNRYILRINGEEKVFDSFGKDIPQEIKDVINVSLIEIDNDKLNLNIAEQLTLPFLLDKPASFRAKLFNKLTGNELIDSLFKLCNKENLRLNREVKSTEEEIKKQEDDLENYSNQYKVLKDKLDAVKDEYKKIQENIEIYEHLKDLAEKIRINKEGKEFVEFKKSQIKLVSEDKIKELKEKAEKLQKVIQIEMGLERVYCDLQEMKYLKSQCVCPKVNFEELKSKDESLQKMKQIKQLIASNKEKLQGINQAISNCKESNEFMEKELKEAWDKCDVCPLCGKENCDAN